MAGVYTSRGVIGWLPDIRRWAQVVARFTAPGGLFFINEIHPVAQAFETIGMAKVAKSAFEAKDMLFLRATDGITMNRDRLLADAKARALAMVEGYQPAEPKPLRLPGPSGRAALNMALEGAARWIERHVGHAVPGMLVKAGAFPGERRAAAG